jgi:CubicO group peptidase (beta-lactamase class C family)
MKRWKAVLLLLAICGSPLLAQEEGGDAAAETKELDPVALEAFVDGYMASYLRDAHVAGAVVTAIEGDDIVFAKGYGLADVNARIPVDANETLFRIGSVSKLFVWTAVMQLVERGQIDLETDVNDYLTDLSVPDEGWGPVTMANLMTHTAGFDERVLGLFARDENALRPLGDVLRDELPARIRPPGDLISYSNHGVALAMYIVEQVSGVPWETYTESNILEPLGLERTSFAQPPFQAGPNRLSKGYRFQDGDFVERPFEFIPLAPVGAVSSCATDMARFLALHLGLGEAYGVRLLGEDYARLMQQTRFRSHPDVNGMALGFMEMDKNDVRIIGHGGDTELFHTLFAFFPEHGIGLFASFNTAGANYDEFLQAFVDWKFPYVPPAPETTDTSALGRFAGAYRPTRFPHHSIAKMSALMSTIDVQAADGALVTRAPQKKRWVQEGPLLFREEWKSNTLGFREDDEGRITNAFVSEMPVMAFERAPVTETPRFVGTALGGGLLLALLAVGFWPLASLIRWHYGVKLDRDERVQRVARWAAWVGGLVLVAFVLGLGVTFSDPMEVVYGLSRTLRTLFWLPALGAVLGVLAMMGALRAWSAGRGTLFGRLAFTLLSLALLVVVWQLWVWNLALPI